MSARKSGSAKKLGSDLARVDAHVIQPHEYDELPELTEEMLQRAKVVNGSRERSPSGHKTVSLRLPEDVVAPWRATGPGWQERIAERLRDFPK